MILSLPQSRQIILHAAGVYKSAPFGHGINAAEKVIKHLSFIQIDTNLVVERTHHHVLWSRVPDYNTSWLQQLQDDQRIVEAWLYATGYMPMKQYRYSLPVKAAMVQRQEKLSTQEITLMRTIHDRIAREGPLRASDFENDRVGKSSGWWDWKPSKIALERMFMGGSLLATRKKDFQKIFDLPENILPSDTSLETPSPEAFAQHIVRSGLTMFGLATAKDIATRARYVKGHRVREELKKMVDNGEVREVSIKGVKDLHYMLPKYEKQKIKLSGNVFILSPFDPLIVFRQRLKDIFDFDYMVECFVPEPKRKYGYFSLPILIGDKFVARMDSKAERKQRKLIVHNLHFEKGTLTKTALKKLAITIDRFAAFNGCDEVEFRKTNKKDWVKVMR